HHLGRGLWRVRVDEVHPRGLGQTGKQPAAVVVDHVPLHLRALHAGLEPPHDAGEDAQPGHLGYLLGALVEHLHADAHPEERRTGLDREPGRAVEAGRPQRLHTPAEVAHAREHDAGSAVDGSRRRDEDGVGADALQPLLRRPEVADAVVENGDHNVPLVEGMSPPSTRTASRNARATPLNDASNTWCGFLPLRMRRCRVTPAAVANARQNSSANWGSNGGEPSGSGAGSTSYCRYGRPDRSRATSTRASSSGNEIDANRRMPALSPSASASASPRAMPTSSTVWWASTSRSPAARSTRPNPPCLPSCASAGSKT